MIETNKSTITEYVNSVNTSLTIISVRKDGVIEIRFKQDDYEVDVTTQQEIHDAFVKLTDSGRIPYHILVIPGQYGGITKEAREKEMFDSTSFQNQHSLCIVAPSLSQRILGTLFFALKKKKPKYPYKLFNTEESAIEWIQNENKSKNN